MKRKKENTARIGSQTGSQIGAQTGVQRGEINDISLLF